MIIEFHYIYVVNPINHCIGEGKANMEEGLPISGGFSSGENEAARNGNGKGSRKGKVIGKDYEENWLEDIRGSLMIVATVIATLTFQISINPPGGVWQEDADTKKGCGSTSCKAGTSVLAFSGRDQKTRYERFIMLCTVSFSTSLTIILLLMIGFPLRNRLVVWSFIIAMCISVKCVAGAYIMAILMVMNPHDDNANLSKAALYYVYFWGGFIALLCFGLFCRFMYWVVRMILCILSCCRCCKPATSN